jgi:hypothetical protein
MKVIVNASIRPSFDAGGDELRSHLNIFTGRKTLLTYEGPISFNPNLLVNAAPAKRRKKPL